MLLLPDWFRNAPLRPKKALGAPDTGRGSTSNRLRLKRAGWDVLVVWECELRDPEAAFEKVRKVRPGFLRPGAPHPL